MKNLIILGSTGSLGKQTLSVLANYQNDFRVIGLSANRNKQLLLSQQKELKISPDCTTLASQDGPRQLLRLATHPDADIIINNLSGTAGIAPSLAALQHGKTLLLSNKETVVSEGSALKPYLSQIIPIDSEHNAIFEILRHHPEQEIQKIYLPCSGGPFLGKTKTELAQVTPQQALNHPTWQMGPKVTIESATLLNKALEVIEAHHLFRLPLNQIQTFIHPECHIHGIVKFKEQTLAYTSPPNMGIHIENALLATLNKFSSKYQIQKLSPDQSFPQPDHHTFPSIQIITELFERDPKSMKTFLQKEEQAINDFLNHKISFLDIFTSLT